MTQPLETKLESKAVPPNMMYRRRPGNNKIYEQIIWDAGYLSGYEKGREGTPFDVEKFEEGLKELIQEGDGTRETPE